VILWKGVVLAVRRVGGSTAVGWMRELVFVGDEWSPFIASAMRTVKIPMSHHWG